MILVIDYVDVIVFVDKRRLYLALDFCQNFVFVSILGALVRSETFR